MDNITNHLTFNFDTTALQSKLPALVAIGLPIATAIYVTKWWIDGKKKLPPLVPYVFPIVGSSIEYAKDPTGFIRKATEKYGSTFRIYVNGRVQTVVGKDHVRSVMLDDEFSFIGALNDVFDTEAMFHGNTSSEFSTGVSPIVSKHITPNLKHFTQRVTYKLAEYEKVWLGEARGPITIDNPNQMIQNMVANASASIFIGKELCENKEFVRTSETLTTDLGQTFQVMGVLFLVPTLAKLYQKFVFKYMNPTSRHIQVIYNTIAPEVERRVREARDQGETWDRPQDVLQSMIEMAPPTIPTSTLIHKIAYDLVSLIFASIHTTTMNSLSVLYAIADHEEFVDELLEEQETVLAEEEEEEKEEGVKFTLHAIKKMAKLDSLVREVLRVTQPAALLAHKNMHNREVVLSDGTVIAKGEHVLMNGLELNRDEGLQGPNPELFNPWRFVNKAKQSSKVGPDFLTFGMGKHACPGRFLALQEIKTLILQLITKYRITRPENDMSAMDPNVIVAEGPLVFTKRE